MPSIPDTRPPFSSWLDPIHRTINADVAYTLSRLQVLERIQGNPIGIAYRRIDEDVVALMAKIFPHLPADAATNPAFRGRGLHAALLGGRLQAAKAAGVDFVFSGAEFLSASHRNMERIGMRIQFIRALWTSFAV